MVVMSIAVGVFAVGMILSSSRLLDEGMNDGWAGINPAHAQLYPDQFDEGLVNTVRHMEGVAEADARRNLGLRFKVGDASVADNDDIPWRNLNLLQYLDYDDIRVFKLKSLSGPFPPPDKSVLIERASLAWMGAQIGDTVLINVGNGRQRELRVAGTVHDPAQMQASWNATAVGYVDRDTLEWFGLSRNFDELHVIAAGANPSRSQLTQLAQELRTKIEKSGRTVYYTSIPTPGKHPAGETVKPMLMILGVLGSLSLILSGLLVVNT
jgi:putative ABC transport system permease protein